MFECKLCDKCFDKSYRYTVHIREHVNDKEVSSAQDYYEKYVDIRPLCVICKEPTEFISVTKGFRKTCSKKTCIKANTELVRKANLLEKYGVDSVSKLDHVKKKNVESNKRTCLEKYGVEFISQLDATKRKMVETLKKTCIETYGVDHPMKVQEHVDKAKETFKEHYGETNPMKNFNVREKQSNTLFEHYGVRAPLKSPTILKKLQDTCVERYGVHNVSLVEEVKEKKHQTSLTRYGVDHPMQSKDIFNRAKETWLTKYGVDFPLRSEEIFSKMVETNLERYGVSNVMQVREIYEKAMDTFIEHYGVDHPLKNQSVVQKSKTTCIEIYGVDHPMKVQEIKDRVQKSLIITIRKRIYETILNTCNEKNITPLFNEESFNDDKRMEFDFLCNTCETKFSSIRIFARVPIVCPTCRKIYNSNMERQICNLIRESYTGDLKINDRSTIKGKELDIYCVDKKLAIELNGVYWHSDKFLPVKYHLEKTLACLDLGINLYHFFETEICKKFDIVKSMISNHLNKSNKLYARNCVSKKIEVSAANKFLKDNHLKSFAPGTKIAFGLYHEDTLVSVMTFSDVEKRAIFGNRKEEDNSCELLRFASLLNTNVVGGFSKLLSFARKDVFFNEIETITTFADVRFSPSYKDTVYFKNGFTYLSTTEPGYWYYQNYELHHRYTFTKQALIDIFEKKGLQIFDDDTEFSLADRLKLIRVYDCGNHKFTLKLNKD